MFSSITKILIKYPTIILILCVWFILSHFFQIRNGGLNFYIDSLQNYLISFYLFPIFILIYFQYIVKNLLKIKYNRLSMGGIFKSKEAIFELLIIIPIIGIIPISISIYQKLFIIKEKVAKGEIVL